MPSLSFDKTTGSKPVAVVKGGSYDSEVLYLHEDGHKGKKPSTEINEKRYATELRDVPSRERIALLRRLSEARKKGLEADQLVGESNIGKALYERIIADESKDSSITLPDDGSTFQIIPSPDPTKREIFYVAGASGSGKSYMAKGIAEMYHKFFPNRPIYLISKLEYDETLDTMNPKPKRIKIQSLIDDYPSINEFADSLTIFDDYDTFTGDADKVVHKLIDDLCITGRHVNCSLILASHYLTNYKKTRLCILETTHIVVYPMATSFHALGYLLKTHVGLTKDDVRDLKKMGRWVCIHKNYPQWLIASQHAKVLNQ